MMKADNADGYEIFTRSHKSVDSIIEQIKNREAIPTSNNHFTYKQILRYLNRSYKMYMKGYELKGTVEFVSGIGTNWYHMKYNNVMYDRYELQGKVERSCDLSNSGYVYYDAKGKQHECEFVDSAHYKIDALKCPSK